jgi:hypothetical protein
MISGSMDVIGMTISCCMQVGGSADFEKRWHS